jgi:hypothetical protein
MFAARDGSEDSGYLRALWHVKLSIIFTPRTRRHPKESLWLPAANADRVAAVGWAHGYRSSYCPAAGVRWA